MVLNYFLVGCPCGLSRGEEKERVHVSPRDFFTLSPIREPVHGLTRKWSLHWRKPCTNLCNFLLRKRFPALFSSSETQGQLVGTIECSRTFYRPSSTGTWQGAMRGPWVPLHQNGGRGRSGNSRSKKTSCWKLQRRWGGGRSQEKRRWKSDLKIKNMCSDLWKMCSLWPSLGTWKLNLVFCRYKKARRLSLFITIIFYCEYDLPSLS